MTPSFFTKTASAEEVYDIYAYAEHLKSAAAERPEERVIPALGHGVAAGAAGIGGAGLGLMANQRLAQSVQKDIFNGRKATPEEIRAFESHISREVPGVKVYSNARDLAKQQLSEIGRKYPGKDIGVGVTRLGDQIEQGGAAAMQISPSRAAGAYVPSQAHPAIKAHELGHLGGSGRGQGMLYKTLRTVGYQAAPLAALLAAGTGATYAGAGTTKEERNKRFRRAQIATALGGGLSAPLLFEEARASKRAVDIGRGVGRGMEYAKKLLPAWGTYATIPVGVTAAGLGGLELLRRRNLNKKDD